MFVEFEKMPDDARIWIYQSDRKLSDSENAMITTKCVEFLTQWAAHGSGLESSAKVFRNRFLIICVDENKAMASGCSIDSSVHFVQSLKNSMNIDFFKRTEVAFLLEDMVVIESLEDIKNNLTSTKITGDSLTFNNLLQKKSDLADKWIIPCKDTWLNRYFKTQTV